MGGVRWLSDGEMVMVMVMASISKPHLDVCGVRQISDMRRTTQDQLPSPSQSVAWIF